MLSIDKILEEIVKLDTLAYPGPWGIIDLAGNWSALVRDSYEAPEIGDESVRGEDNLRLVVALRNALPALLAEFARLKKIEQEKEAFDAMANLLATDEAFANHTRGGGIGFNILCSDTFAWACADAEAIDISQAPEVWKLYQEGGWSAVSLWVQEKRGGEKFIKPVEDLIEKSKAILAERDALLVENAQLRAGGK